MDETVEELRNNGTYITTIDHYGFKISLYSMDLEFYEVAYRPTDNRVWKVSEAGKDDLEKYVNGIDLSF